MMTVTEAAAILGISERAIRYRLERGLMAGERAGTWIWLIPEEEVERVRLAPPLLGRKPTRRPPPSDTPPLTMTDERPPDPPNQPV